MMPPIWFAVLDIHVSLVCICCVLGDPSMGTHTTHTHTPCHHRHQAFGIIVRFNLTSCRYIREAIVFVAYFYFTQIIRMFENFQGDNCS